jgi:uncharacterized membrane protein
MAKAPAPPRALPIVGAFAARPRLVSALALGLAVFVGLSSIRDVAWTTSAILAWDVVCIGFLAMVFPIMTGKDSGSIRAKAATQDQGQGVILALAVVAGAASIAAVAAELSLAREAAGLEKALRIALAFGTVACSWSFVQFIFALHYAHEYYGPEATRKNAKGCGLRFPDDDDPDYWDFVHFSIVIGVACQTADIAFTSKALRRIGGIHGVFAFVFNTGVLALTVNLVAGLLT